MKFKLYYSYKSLIKNPILTFLTIICLVGSTLILIASCSITDACDELLRQETYNKYGNYDVLLSSDSDVDNFYALSSNISKVFDYYDDFISFFLAVATISSTDFNSDVDLMISDTQSLNKLTNLTYKELNTGDVIISRSFSEQLNVVEGDVVELSYSNYSTTLCILEIVDDTSIFSYSNEVPKIVIDHSTMTNIFSLYSKNIFNVALFKTNDERLCDELRGIFPYFNVVCVYDNELNDFIVNKTSSYALVIGIPCFLLCLIISSTVLTYFQRYNNKEFDKLFKLGLLKKDILIIKIIQCCIITSISYFSILFLCDNLVDMMNWFYNMNYQFSKFDIFFYSIYTITIPFILNLLIHFKKNNEVNNIVLLISNFVLSVLIIILATKINKYTIIILCMGVYIYIFTLPILIKKIISKFISKKDSLFSNIIKIEKCSILSILTLSILITIAMSDYYNLAVQANIVLSDYNDITITNFDTNKDYEVLFNDYDCHFIYEKNNILVNDLEVYQLYGVSSYNDINKIYNLSSDNKSLNNYEIILSSYYYDIEGIRVNDSVDVVINNITFKLNVSGFVYSDINNTKFCYINFETLQNIYNVSNYNKIIIKNSIGYFDDINDILKNENVNSRLYTGRSISTEVFTKNIFLIITISSFIIIIITIELIFVSMLRYKDMKNELAIIKMIGCSNKKIISNELCLILLKLVITIISSLCITIFSSYFFKELFYIREVYSTYNLGNIKNICTFIFILIYLITETAFKIIYFNFYKN